MSVTHTFVSGKADGADATLVRPSDWNATHTITPGTIASILSDHNKAAHDALGIDHTTLANIGTHSHAVIDTEIDTTLPGLVTTHAALATGVHGAGASTIATAATLATHATLILNPAVHPNPLSTKTEGYTATPDDFVIECDATTAGFVISLPTSVGIKGKIYNIKKIDSSTNAVTIDANGSETIDGVLTLGLYGQYDSYTIVSNDANWDII